MTVRTGAIQVIGSLLLIALLAYAMPIITQIITTQTEKDVKATLQAEGITWANIKTQGRDITISGIARNGEEYQKALNILRSVWLVRNIQNDIQPQSVGIYTMAMQMDKESLQIKGYVASDKDKETLEQQAKQLFPSKKITLALQTGLGAPNDWIEVNKGLLSEISKLDIASLDIINNSVEISGKIAKSQHIPTFDQALQAFRAKGYTINTQLFAHDRSILACQEKFNALLSKNKIYFETAQSIIAKQSDDLLTKIVENAVICGNSTITIVGHTDDIGSAAENQALSYQRAQAVKGRLFSQGGIPLERLNAVGKGASEPIDTNDTEAGRANNRRIEFIVEGLE
jgi:OOP family OmpA-OmpF porin